MGNWVETADGPGHWESRAEERARLTSLGKSQMVERFDPDGSRRAKVERDHGGLPAMPESCDHCLTVLERGAIVEERDRWKARAHYLLTTDPADWQTEVMKWLT